jgi:hypothetical protein
LGTSENHLGPSLDYMLDAQNLPSQTLEALHDKCLNVGGDYVEK